MRTLPIKLKSFDVWGELELEVCNFLFFFQVYHQNCLAIFQARMHFNPKEDWASTEEGRRKLVKALMNNSLGASVGIGAVDPNDLPRRYLPPGSFGITANYMLRLYLFYGVIIQ